MINGDDIRGPFVTIPFICSWGQENLKNEVTVFDYSFFGPNSLFILLLLTVILLTVQGKFLDSGKEVDITKYL